MPSMRRYFLATSAGPHSLFLMISAFFIVLSIDDYTLMLRFGFVISIALDVFSRYLLAFHFLVDMRSGMFLFSFGE